MTSIRSTGGAGSLLLALELLSPRERRQAALLIVIAIAMAMFDVVGMASIMPFLAVMAKPEVVRSKAEYLGLISDLGLNDTTRLLYALGAASFVLLVASGLVRVFGQYEINKFTQNRAHEISIRLFEGYLKHDYQYHLNKHSGEISKLVLSEAGLLVSQVYTPASQIIAQSAVVLMLTLLLVLVDPVVALTVAAVFIALYMLFYLILRPRLSRIGLERMQANVQRFRFVGEALGGIKIIKLLGRESVYVDRLGRASAVMVKHQVAASTVASVPKFVVEFVGFGGIIALALGLLVRHGGHEAGAMGSVLLLLGVYAFVGYRLLPAVQQIYAAATLLRTGSASLRAVYDAIEEAKSLPPLRRQRAEPLPLKHNICLDNVSFTYAGSSKPSLTGVSVEIPAGTAVGIVGSSGAGKTTLVDLVLGLIRPSAGQLRVDNVVIDCENVRDWQAAIGYVPQDIFLIDGSVWENIAFGVPEDVVDKVRVRECARMAQALDFVEQSLPQGFDTTIGERGVRISGGQRQRLGIARAILADPAVVVFDEATSALDSLTERVVMDAIGVLRRSKTVLIVAHRMQTIRECDFLVMMREGQIEAMGTYDSLVETNPAFRALATGSANGLLAS